jgi:hypothetical protein
VLPLLAQFFLILDCLFGRTHEQSGFKIERSACSISLAHS